MKIAILLTYLIPTSLAFAPSAMLRTQQQHQHVTPLPMFGGAGEGMVEDPANEAQMAAAAKQLGVPLDEYKLGMQARIRLSKQLDEARITAGDETKIAIERDANNPPKYLEIIVTEEGKALGKDVVTKEVLAQLQSTADFAKTKRNDAQKEMMMWIGDEMKKRGK